MKTAHRPATRRSAERRLGDRLRISSWCLMRTDSATTELTPPGPASRAMVASRCRNRMDRSRTAGSYQDRDAGKECSRIWNSPCTGRVYRDISVRITIQCSTRTDGWQTIGFLEIDEIKTVPHVPVSHTFVERLIGTMRREFLDHMLSWNARDLERKLAEFKAYYNAARCHASLDGLTPLIFAGHHRIPTADLNHVRWVSYCRDLVQLPAAA